LTKVGISKNEKRRIPLTSDPEVGKTTSGPEKKITPQVI